MPMWRNRGQRSVLMSTESVALATPFFLKTRIVWTCIRLIIVIGAVMAIVAFPTPHLRAGQPENQRVRAPELEGGVAWLNTAGPIRIKDLKGKIVVLDSWSFCCI